MSYRAEIETRAGTEVVTLSSSAGSAAEIVPAWGNNCIAFRAPDPVFDPVPFDELAAKPTSSGNPILFPFPNRASEGVLRYGGKSYRVSPPRHGFVRDKPWRVIDRGASDSEGAYLRSALDAGDFRREILDQFPFSFRLEVTLRLMERRLEMETVVRNDGEAPLPFGFGIHPYFVRPARGTLTVPAAKRWELADSLPTGKLLDVTGSHDLRTPRDVNELELDDVYDALVAAPDGQARSVLRDEDLGREIVVSSAARDFPEIVVYTAPAPRRALCIEPYTCPTDVFNLAARGIDSHLIELAPGSSRAFRITFEARPI
ncbi:MAG: aldose 1-epimerase [Candidatus Binatia bacterium]